ncbi:hypothetical protein CA984_36390, partial [Streptosporangium minutum]
MLIRGNDTGIRSSRRRATIGERIGMQVGRGVLSVAAGLILVALATVGYALPPPFDPPPLSVDPVFQTLP